MATKKRRNVNKKPMSTQESKKQDSTPSDPSTPMEDKIQVVQGNTDVLSIRLLNAINQNIVALRQELVSLTSYIKFKDMPQNKDK